MALISALKGWLGEAQTMLAHLIKLDASIYKQFNNVTINTDIGTTQIDHVIVSKYGIFVVETKNMNGWIYGTEKQSQWTQAFYKKKFKFQNPLHQNYRHTKALSEFLQLDHDKFHSIVFFWGECELKTELPPNVMTSGYTNYIKSKTDVLFSDEDVAAICDAITTGRLPKTWKTSATHVKSLQEKYTNTEICPKCGGVLTLRTAKKGTNAGSQFYGCGNFPTCKYMRPMA